MGMKKIQKIYNFNDFANIVDAKGKAVVMDFNDFLHIHRGVSQGELACSKPYFDDVRVV